MKLASRPRRAIAACLLAVGVLVVGAASFRPSRQERPPMTIDFAAALVGRVAPPFVVGTSTLTVTVPNARSNDIMVVDVSVFNGLVVSSITSTGSPTWSQVNSSNDPSRGLDLEWWTAPATVGTNVITVTTTGSTTVGAWAGLLANAGTPVSGMTASAPVGLAIPPTTVPWTAMTVANGGSWAAVASFVSGQSLAGNIEQDSGTGLGTFDTGPLLFGDQYSGVTYGRADANIPAGLGWSIDDPAGGYWATAGIVVPPA